MAPSHCIVEVMSCFLMGPSHCIVEVMSCCLMAPSHCIVEVMSCCLMAPSHCTHSWGNVLLPDGTKPLYSWGNVLLPNGTKPLHSWGNVLLHDGTKPLHSWGNVSLPDGTKPLLLSSTKPLPGAILTYHQCDIHLRAISQEIPEPSISKISLKMTSLKSHSNLPWASELMLYCLKPNIIICYICFKYRHFCCLTNIFYAVSILFAFVWSLCWM